MNFKRMGVAAAGVILLAASTIFGQDAGRRLDGTANRLDRSPVGATAGGLTAGRVTLSNATGQVTDDAGLTYNRTTDTLTVANGAVVASNVTASGLATPGSITVTPTLTETASITTVAAGWRATGLLTLIPGNDLGDGETFVLSDGTHVPQSFEFDLASDGVVGGHVEIDVAGTEDAIAVGALCAAAINATTGAGFTYEAIDNLDGTVTLRNTTWAAAGNTAQSETVAEAGFVVTNMTGGVDAGIIDGDYFTVKYSGSGTVPVEFDIGDGTTGGRIPLIFTGTETADDIRDAIITLLNTAAPTQLTASSGGAATVNIVLDTPGATGDTNTENVSDAGFAVTGFADPTHATTVTYQLVACLADGSCTEPGADSTTGTATATLSASNFNALSWTAVSGAASYKVYRKVAPTSPATVGVIYSGTALAVNDTGLVGDTTTASAVDGTGRVTADGLTIATGAAAGHVLTADASGNATWQAGGGGSPGGTAGQLQYNADGEFAGVPGSSVHDEGDGYAINIAPEGPDSGVSLNAWDPDNGANRAALSLYPGAAVLDTYINGGGQTELRLEPIQASLAAYAYGGSPTSTVTVAPTSITLASLAVFIPGLPTYADNAAAITGGLAENQLYRTSTGVLMVVYAP